MPCSLTASHHFSLFHQIVVIVAKINKLEEQTDATMSDRIHRAIVVLVESVRSKSEMGTTAVVKETTPAEAGIKEAAAGKGYDSNAIRESLTRMER
jgi:hypothetical protein